MFSAPSEVSSGAQASAALVCSWLLPLQLLLRSRNDCPSWNLQPWRDYALAGARLTESLPAALHPKARSAIHGPGRGGGLKITVLKTVSGDFVRLPASWLGAHLQPGLCNHQKWPKGRAGKVRSSHTARPPCAHPLGNALDVPRLPEKEKDLWMLLSPFATRPRTSRFSAFASAAALGCACASHSGSSEARAARRGAGELAAPSDISARPPASVAMAMRVWG